MTGIFLLDTHKSFAEGMKSYIEEKRIPFEIIGSANDLEKLSLLSVSDKADVFLLACNSDEKICLKRLSEFAAPGDSKIIILSSQGTFAATEDAILLGAKGFVSKRESFQTIFKAIEKVSQGETWLDHKTIGKTLDAILRERNNRQETDKEKAALLKNVTLREREIIAALVNSELSANKEIARSLFISESTLKNHLNSIYSKLEVKNRTELVKLAISRHLV